MTNPAFRKAMLSMPLAKVMNAYRNISGNTNGLITKGQAIDWLEQGLWKKNFSWQDVEQATPLAHVSTPVGTVGDEIKDKFDSVNARFNDLNAHLADARARTITANDQIGTIQSDLSATKNDIDGLHTVTATLITQVNNLSTKVGKFSLDEAQINNAVAQVIDTAFAPFRKAVEDAGLQEVVADLTSVRVIDRRSALDVFGVEVTDIKGNPLMVDIYNHPAAPDVDPLFIWTRPILEDLLGVQETGENLWFGGDRGTGKSETARQFAARTGRNFARVNYHKHSSADEFIGAVGLENGQTTFKCGSFLQAFLTPSTVILNDEISNAPEGELATLNPLLEPNCAVIYGGAVRRRAPGVMIFAADNTLGNGDESGRYAGTRTMNSALIDRFARIIHFQYLPMDEEAKAVVNHTGCTDELARHVLTCIHAARGKVSDGEIIDAPSIRSVVAFIRALKTKKVEDAWMSCIVSRQPSESKPALLALAEAYLDKALINANL